ncbi:MAG: adenosylcobinamide kinase/adenosylcobinamide-phosphate guanylyltransferase [Pseudomonadales bacterium]|jgi:adenosylcobinamide kinase/adenosylcobinamide-phosphate guanylyltransferase
MTLDSELILGGARSGKSKLAEQRAAESGLKLVYIATGTAGDNEMRERIAHHQTSRDKKWQLVEEPINLADALLLYSNTENCILVDCLTLWLSNCLHQDCWHEQRDKLLAAFSQLNGRVLFVSNEVGMGITPMGELTRRFVDESGFLHQQLASMCDQVMLVVAGLPLQIKPTAENR